MRRYKAVFIALASVVTLGWMARVMRADTAQQEAKLKKVLSEFEGSRVALPKLSGINSSDPSCSLGPGAVRARDLREQLDGLKQQLMSKLEDISIAAPLQAYIARSFPSAPSGVRSRCYDSPMLSAQEALRAQQTAKVFVADVASKAKTTIDVVTVKSDPTHAAFEFWPYALADAAHKTSLATNTTKKHVPRGLYGYRVTKDGYASIDGYTLELMDGSEVAIACTLTANSNGDAGTPAKSLPCNPTVEK